MRTRGATNGSADGRRARRRFGVGPRPPLLRWLLYSETISSGWRAALGGLFAVVVLGLVKLLQGPLGSVRFSLLVGTIAAAAILGGTSSGVVALAVSLAGLDLLFELDPRQAPFPSRGAELIDLFIFAGIALLGMLGAVALRHAMNALESSRKRLESSEERFRLLADDAPDVVYRYRMLPTPALEFISSAATRVLGYPPDAYRADPGLWQRQVHPDDAALLRDPAIAAEGRSATARFIRRDGQVIWLEVRGSPIRDAQGRMTAVQGIARDVSARKRAEREEQLFSAASQVLAGSLETRQGIEQFTQLVARNIASLCTLTYLDGDQAVVEARARSSEASDLAAAPLEALAHAAQRSSPGDAPLCAPEIDRASLDPALADAARALSVRSLMVIPLAAGGRRLGVLCLADPQPGRLQPSALPFIQRLADRCAIALENARLYQSAQRALRQRDRVLALVSHDLKSPLTAILLAVTSLEAHVDAGAPRSSAALIRRAAERMERLIRDLLDLSALDAGKLSLVHREIDARVLLRDVAEAFASAAHERSVALILEAPERPLSLRCDPDRMLQVLSNLVSNALAATPARGAITLRATPRGDAVEFTVADTGKGIAADELPHLFERFRRGRSSAYSGTGLGLAISRALVDAHGGHLSAQSVLGRGTVFTVAMPGARPGAPSAATHAPSAT